MAKSNKKSTTSKKMKYVGTIQFINPQTGELEDFQVSDIEERDFGFFKIWMRDFISTLEIVGNQKTKVCYWIVDNINRENELTYTYRQIADETKTSLETVRTTMTALLQADFLRRKNQGVYVVNPDIIFKGGHKNRLNLLHRYYDLNKPPEISTQEKIQNIQFAISQLTEELNKLTEKTLIEGENNVAEG